MLTALLVFVVASTFHKNFPGGFGGVAVGLVLTLIHLISIPVDNTSVNPARCLGVAVFEGGWALKQLWVFIVFPLIGGALGALLWRLPRPARTRSSRAGDATRYDWPEALGRSSRGGFAHPGAVSCSGWRSSVPGPIRRSTRSEPTARSSRNAPLSRARQ